MDIQTIPVLTCMEILPPAWLFAKHFMHISHHLILTMTQYNTAYLLLIILFVILTTLLLIVVPGVK